MTIAFEDVLVKVAQLQLDCHEIIAEEFEHHTILFHDTFGSQTQHVVKAHDFVAPFLAGLIPNFLRGVKLAYLAPDDQWIDLDIPTTSPHADDFTMDTFAEHPLWTQKQLKTLLSPIIWFGDMAVRLKFPPMTTVAQTQAHIRTTLKRFDVEIQCQPEQMAQTLLAYEAHTRPIILTSQADDIGFFQLQQRSQLMTLNVDDKSIMVHDSMSWSQLKSQLGLERLVKNGQVVFGRQHQTLAQVGLQTGDELKQESVGAHVLVKTLTGVTITIPIQMTDTVQLLKQLIEEQTGVDADQMRLIFCGKQLQDDKRLSEYKIEDWSTLHMLLRMRGGMYHVTSGRQGYAGIVLKCGDNMSQLQRFLQVKRGPSETSSDFLVRCRAEINWVRRLVKTHELELHQPQSSLSTSIWDKIDADFHKVKALIAAQLETDHDDEESEPLQKTNQN